MPDLFDDDEDDFNDDISSEPEVIEENSFELDRAEKAIEATPPKEQIVNKTKKLPEKLARKGVKAMVLHMKNGKKVIYV